MYLKCKSIDNFLLDMIRKGEINSVCKKKINRKMINANENYKEYTAIEIT